MKIYYSRVFLQKRKTSVEKETPAKKSPIKRTAAKKASPATKKAVAAQASSSGSNQENIASFFSSAAATSSKGNEPADKSTAPAGNDVEMTEPSQSSPDSTVYNENKTIEEIYQKKTQLEHILLRPDSYIGSIEAEEQEMWVFDSEEDTIKKKKIKYVPGLYKIVDEILVNAADNKVTTQFYNTSI